MKIKKSYSNDGQDVFVSAISSEKGFFLDIGCNHPMTDNNTYALELLGWNGILIDYIPVMIEKCKETRKSPAFLHDCSQLDWRAFLKENNVPKVIDYISLDVDDANTEVIKNFPFDEYEFKIMTFETDVYKRENARKTPCIEALAPYPFYKMILENSIVSWCDYVAEDWWINTKCINLPDELYSKNKKWTQFNQELLEWLNKT